MEGRTLTSKNIKYSIINCVYPNYHISHVRYFLGRRHIKWWRHGCQEGRSPSTAPLLKHGSLPLSSLSCLQDRLTSIWTSIKVYTWEIYQMKKDCYNCLGRHVCKMCKASFQHLHHHPPCLYWNKSLVTCYVCPLKKKG